MTATLCLIDGHALAYRTYFALTVGAGSSTAGSGNRWITSKGESTAGVFGFTSVLLRILEQERFDYIAVAFDTGRTFRHEIYPEYKATRAKMPDDLRPQIERIRQIVDAFNMPRLEMEGYEADDVLGSTACKSAQQGLGVKIFTGDRDLLQLVSDKIIVNLPGKTLSESRDFYTSDVISLLGIRPDQVVDMKALMGDKSDNIPGITGIGEKTAVNLLKTYDSLDEIYKHTQEIGGSTQKKLETGRESAYLSQKLAKIITDLDVQMDLAKARTEHFNPAAVETIFRDLEFRALIKRFQAWVATVKPVAVASSENTAVKGKQISFLSADRPPAELPPSEIQASDKVVDKVFPSKWSIIDSIQSLHELSEKLNHARCIAFDTESTSTDPMQAELVGISLAYHEGEGYYIPINHRYMEDLSNNLPIETVIGALMPSLTNVNIPKFGHNAKYDYIILSRYGLTVTPIVFDTMIAEWLLNPDSHNLGLKRLAWVRMNFQMTEIETLIGKGKNQITMDQVPLVNAAPYAVADADSVLRLEPILDNELKGKSSPFHFKTIPASPELYRLYQDVEIPLIPVLAKMEMTGISLDTQYLRQMSKDILERMHGLEEKIYQAAGYRFNLNSTQQLSTALFDRLQLTIPGRTRRTASGSYSTSADVLEGLVGQHPVIEWILEYREISKLKSTYIDALPQQLNPITNRIHTSYNQTGSVTGRLASSNPNLQNIPIRTDLGRQVRKAFVAIPNHFLVSVDYSQVELRIVAHMAQDQAMIEAFIAGQDIHATTAAAVYNIPLDQVTKDQRRHAKAINFGLIYGMSAFGLTRSSDLTLAEAEDFVSTYFKRFPAIKNYLDQVRAKAAQDGFVETIFGRRRYFPTLKLTTHKGGLSREEREAINAPIQGTASDIIKIAMIKLAKALDDTKLNAAMLLQVHDELVLECPVSERDNIIKVVREIMENACTLSVPLASEAKYGTNWGELQSYNV